MTDFIVLGTDTGVGKTTFALLWLTARAGGHEYWKPLETGPADSNLIAALCPGVVVHPSLRQFAEPVAPLLAARHLGQNIPSLSTILGAKPRCSQPGRSLLVESFGSPFSPLDDERLQIEFLRALALPMVLVTDTKVGTIGRTLACCRALAAEGLSLNAVVLLGAADSFANQEIERRFPGMPVFPLHPPEAWTVEALRQAALGQVPVFDKLQKCLAGELSLTKPGLATRTNDLSAAPWIARDQATVWHPYTPLQGADPPLVCVGAQDEFLLLADGRRLIDATSSWWTILHGHRHPVLLQALQQATRQIDHVMFAGVTHPWAIALAEKMLASMPWTGGRAFYSDNGSTAVEVALKMAYQFWCGQGQAHRTRFVGFEHGYHGDTFGAMAVSRDPVFFGRFEPLLFQADILPLDPQRLDDHLKQHRDQVAGVILEPLVQGAGGMRMHTEALLQEIFAVTRRHDVLFLADEVMTGCGRTGTLWAFQAAGIAPDIVATAKTLAGGVLSLAVTLAGPRVVAAFDHADRRNTLFHGHSFTAHPLACAVALASWEELLPKLPVIPRRLEEFWREALTTLRQLPMVQDVRVRGMIAAVETKSSGGYLAAAGGLMRRVALEHGVLLRPLGNVLYALPPLCISQDSLQRIAEAMTAAVQAACAL